MHEIDITDGQAAFADSRTDALGRVSAWHKLGTPIGHLMTVDEALDAAHLRGWDVRKVPLTAMVPGVGDDSLALEVPDRHVVLRTNPVNGRTEALGTVGNVWTPFQNEDTTSLLSALVDEGGAHIETAGALRGGRDTFVTMRLPGHMEFRSPKTGQIDTTDLFISVLNNHEGGAPLRALIGAVRIVCANTQRMAESSARSTVSLRHTGDPRTRLQEIRDLLGLSFKYRDVFVEQMEQLIVTEMDTVQVLDVLEDVWNVKGATTERQEKARKTTAASVFEVYQTSTTVRPFYGTAAGAYNAVTEWADHLSPVGRKEDSEEEKAIKRARRTLASTDMGDLKARAFTALLPA